jgi:nucleoside-diphosphate-sugar epimerase
MNKVAIIGANGFVGKAITKAFLQSGENDVVQVVSDNYELIKEQQTKFDIIIHSAMPSKRWWAANNPIEDFDATVRLTADILYNWKFKKIALISSVSARLQTNHPYGRHKHLAEVLVSDHSSENVIFRLGGLFGEGLDKGVIFDMIEGNEVFMTSESAFNYIDTETASKLILKYIHDIGIIEIGAKNTISIGEIAQYFDLKVQFGNRIEYQSTEYPKSDFPDAKEIIPYIHNLISKKNDRL